MLETLVAGGPVMIPIALCSIIALAVFLERLWVLRRERILPHALYVQATELARQARFDDAITLCRTAEVPLARVLEMAFIERAHPRSHIKERLEEVGRREAAELERGLPVLGTIASISPLLGLLGTVGGMILTFSVIQQQGLGNVGSLAGGISQALITTFAGLTVGIPALVANRYLLSRVDSLLLELEAAALDALEIVAGPVEPRAS